MDDLFGSMSSFDLEISPSSYTSGDELFGDVSGGVTSSELEFVTFALFGFRFSDLVRRCQNFDGRTCLVVPVLAIV